MSGNLTVNARLDVGNGSGGDTEIRIYKADNNVSDHIQFYNGTTRIGEIGCQDTTWLRINQVTAKNIYTPRYMRADGGFFVDGTTYGINGSGTMLSNTGATIGGNTAWHAGNDGPGSGLDADTLDGAQPSVSASNSTIVQRHSSGYIYANYFNTTPNDVTSGITKILCETGNDGFMRHATAAAVRTFINVADGATAVTNNNQLTNGAGYITSADGGNAATLDGIDSSQFLRSDTNDTFSGGSLSFGSTTRQMINLWSTTYGFGIQSSTLYYRSGSRFSWFRGGSHSDTENNAGTGGSVAMTLDGSSNLTVSGNVTAYSDIKLKKNIEVIPNALDKVMQLRGVTYDRVDMDSPRQTGIIAQEVEEVLPEAVQTDEEGIKSVAYGNIVSLLIEAIKEQQERINRLEEIGGIDSNSSEKL